MDILTDSPSSPMAARDVSMFLQDSVTRYLKIARGLAAPGELPGSLPVVV